VASTTGVSNTGATLGNNGLLAPYRAVLASRLRAQASYRGSFAADLFGSLLVAATEFAELWALFHNIDSLGGLDFHAMLMVFGIGEFSFAAADLLLGHLDTMPTFIRAGTLEAFYLRPLSLLGQLMTSEIGLRRLTRMGFAAVAAGCGFAWNDIDWGVGVVGMLVLSLVMGTALFGGLFVWAAGAQFFLVNGAEFTNAITYGGAYASKQPASIFPNPLRVFFGFVVPVAFVAYLPTLWILGLPGPALMPTWLAWFSPVAVALVSAIAWLLWRAGTRHYQGGGG
jgi:viologen exporter family transport system permease protein